PCCSTTNSPSAPTMPFARASSTTRRSTPSSPTCPRSSSKLRLGYNDPKPAKVSECGDYSPLLDFRSATKMPADHPKILKRGELPALRNARLVSNECLY